jgi:hypothetical protein
MEWLRERGLTLVLGGLFLVFIAAQFATGLADYNEDQARRGAPSIDMSDYVRTGRAWEATFENWESEFLQFLAIASMVWLSVYLRERGSPESKPVHASHDETGH